MKKKMIKSKQPEVIIVVLVQERQVLVVLKLPREGGYPAKLVAVKAVYAKITSPGCMVTFDGLRVTALGNAVILFNDKQVDAKNKVPGAVSARNNAFKGVNNMLQHEFLGIIQTAMDADPLNATNIAISCGYAVQIITIAAKEEFTVVNTGNPGELKFNVNVKALLIPGVTKIKFVEYQQGTNPNIFTPIPDTAGANSKMIRGGFPSNSTMYFRARLIFTRGRKSQWVFSAPVKVG